MTKDAVRVGRWVTTRLRGSAGRSAAVLLMLLTLATLASLWPVAAGPADPREVMLVTRDMAFYVDGSDTPNPVLTMHAGETVRVVLHNEDVGMNHNFEIPWAQAISAAPRGPIASVLIEVPDRPGRHEYICGPHAALMRGVIEVVEAE